MDKSVSPKESLEKKRIIFRIDSFYVSLLKTYCKNEKKSISEVLGTIFSQFLVNPIGVSFSFDEAMLLNKTFSNYVVIDSSKQRLQFLVDLESFHLFEFFSTTIGLDVSSCFRLVFLKWLITECDLTSVGYEIIK